MTPELLNYLCEPVTKSLLDLVNPIYDQEGNIISGQLVSISGKVYPITNGIPRFIDLVETKTVESFGNEWNHFNFTDFKINWLQHTVKNTFGDSSVFENKVIIDAGGGERCTNAVVC